MALEHGHQSDDRSRHQATGPASPPSPVDQRIERLSTASLKRIVEPDTDVAGAIGDGQVLPDES